jgi:hypothetical protein
LGGIQRRVGTASQRPGIPQIPQNWTYFAPGVTFSIGPSFNIRYYRSHLKNFKITQITQNEMFWLQVSLFLSGDRLLSSSPQPLPRPSLSNPLTCPLRTCRFGLTEEKVLSLGDWVADRPRVSRGGGVFLALGDEVSLAVGDGVLLAVRNGDSLTVGDGVSLNVGDDVLPLVGDGVPQTLDDADF